ncbi:MAG: RNA polymerase sigma factor [Proteobacteria bacterium]|nr:RNA polymerase sigma factor [Pseudomonadota bacterium]MBU1639074.1 RNA polymerase sigma factor [Pseudomonadota bacterium]
METFLTSVQGRAFRMAEIATKSRDDALDIVQDTMYDFVRRYRRHDDKEWHPLFFRVLQNKIRDWYRRTAIRRRFGGWLSLGSKSAEPERTEDPFDQVADSKGKSPEHNLELQDSLNHLSNALKNLPHKQQQVFLMRAWEGFSTKETATIMKCSAGTVKTHYWRALNTLQEKLKDHRS